jgi:hypothetical protein
VPLREPLPLGVNTIGRPHPVNDGIGFGQVFGWMEKSPEIESEYPSGGAPVPLPKVTSCCAPEFPITMEPKFREVGVICRGAAPLPVNEITCVTIPPEKATVIVAVS